MSGVDIPADLGVMADLGRFDSATISNAIESFAVRPRTSGFTDCTIRAMYPDLPPMVGRAVTCRFENASDSKQKPNRLPDLLDLVHESTVPVVVVCASMDDDPERSCLVGDLIAALLQRLGAAGIVTDCGARDLDVVRRRAPGFQIFARGTVASHGSGTVLAVGGEVVVGGLIVQPGDLLHGDHNGVVAVPDAIAAEVSSAAQRVWDTEDALQRRIRAEPLDYASLRADFTH